MLLQKWMHVYLISVPCQGGFSASFRLFTFPLSYFFNSWAWLHDISDPGNWTRIANYPEGTRQKLSCQRAELADGRKVVVAVGGTASGAAQVRRRAFFRCILQKN